MTSPQNVVVISKKLILFTKRAVDDHVRSELIKQICYLAEKFAPDPFWYIDNMSQLFEVGPQFVPQSAIQNMLSVIAEGTGDDEDNDTKLRVYCVDAFCDLLTTKPALHDLHIQVISWVLGEYGFMSEKYGQDAIIELLCDMTEHPLEEDETRGIIISAIMKLTARVGSLVPAVDETIQKYKFSKNVDVQQRCHEFINMMKFNSEAIYEVLPEDGSCQDIEVDDELSFLDDYVQQARNMGLPDYVDENSRSSIEQVIVDAPKKKQIIYKEYEKPQSNLPGILNPYNTTQGSVITTMNTTADPSQPASFYPTNPENLGGLDGKLFQNKKKVWFEDDDEESQQQQQQPAVPANNEYSLNNPSVPVAQPISQPSPFMQQPEQPLFPLSKQDPTPVTKKVSKKTQQLVSGIFGGQPSSNQGTGAKPERKRRKSKNSNSQPPMFNLETTTANPVKQQPQQQLISDDLFDMSMPASPSMPSVPMTNTPPKSQFGKPQQQPAQSIDLLEDFLGPSTVVQQPPAVKSNKDSIMDLLDNPFGAPVAKPSTPTEKPMVPMSLAQQQQMKVTSPEMPVSVAKPGYLLAKLMELYPRAHLNPTSILKDTYISVNFNKFFKDDELILAFILSTDRGYVLTSINCQFQAPDKFGLEIETDGVNAVVRSNNNSVSIPKLEPGNPIAVLVKLKIPSLGFGNSFMGTIGYTDDQKRTKFNPISIPIEGADTFRAEVANTSEYGSMWKNTHTVQKSVAIKGTFGVEQMRDKMKETLHIHIVSVIKTEVIAVGRVMGLDAVFLVHMNIGQQNVFTVRSKDVMLSDLVCRAATKALAQ